MGKREREVKSNKSSKKAKVVSFASPTSKTAIMKKRYGTKLEATPEIKILDTDFVAVTPTSTGAVTLLNGMAQGTTLATRIGQKIEMCSVDYKLWYGMTTAELASVNLPVPNNDGIFIAVVYDRQSNGAAPVWSDVFTNSTTAGAVCGHRAVGNYDRFEVLSLERHMINTGGPYNTYMERHIKMSHEVRYNAGAAGTIADIQSGGLFLLYASTNPIAFVAASGDLNGEVRLAFRDL